MRRGTRLIALSVAFLALGLAPSAAIPQDLATRAIEYVRALLARDYGAIYDSLTPETIADLGALDRKAFCRLAPRVGLVPEGYPSLDSVLLAGGKAEVEPNGSQGKAEVTARARGGTESGSIWIHMERGPRGWLVCEPDTKQARLFLGTRVVLLPLTAYDRLRQKREWSELPSCFTRTGAAKVFGERFDERAVSEAVDKEERILGRFIGLDYYWKQVEREGSRASLPVQFAYQRPAGTRFVPLKVTLVRDMERGEWLIDRLEPAKEPEPADLFPDIKDAADKAFLRRYAPVIEAYQNRRWDLAISQAQLVLADPQLTANEKAFGHLLMGAALFEKAFQKEELHAADAEFGRVLIVTLPQDDDAAYHGTALRLSGGARSGMGDYTAAADRFLQLLRDYPGLKASENSVLALPGALSKSGRSAEIAQVLGTVADKAPGTGTARVALQELAGYYERGGDVERAREAYLKLIQQFPATPTAKNAQQQFERLKAPDSGAMRLSNCVGTRVAGGIGRYRQAFGDADTAANSSIRESAEDEEAFCRPNSERW